MNKAMRILTRPIVAQCWPQSGSNAGQKLRNRSILLRKFSQLTSIAQASPLDPWRTGRAAHRDVA